MDKILISGVAGAIASIAFSSCGLFDAWQFFAISIIVAIQQRQVENGIGGN